MLEFFRSSRRNAEDDVGTGTFADAFLQMSEQQKALYQSREDGHAAHSRDYGKQRVVYRRSMGYA